MIKYVAPIYLLAIFIPFCMKSVPEYVAKLSENDVARHSLMFIGVVLAFMILLVHIAGKRWKRNGVFRNLAIEEDVLPVKPLEELR